MTFFLLLLVVLECAASTPALGDEIPKQTPSVQPFTHPGLLHSNGDLDFIKQKLITGEQPWKSAWNDLQSSKVASLDYAPNPLAKVVRGVRNNPDIGSSDMSDDAAAAYAHALQWSLTAKKAHATKSIEILNAWAKTLESVSGHDARLLVGMDGVVFCNAAELIRHTSTEWRGEDQKHFERMLRQVFYPVIKDFYPTANGNWDASMIQTMIAMGIFLDDRAMFDRAIEYYRHGKGNGAIEKYFNEFGECQESGRDQLHVQMGIGFLACACEMAWKQGVDLYGAADNRLARGFEYTAKYNLGEDVPYERYRSVEGRYDYPTISRKGRGRFRPIYERIVHHYHDRLGMEMPYSRRVADQERPEGSHGQHMSWGTLTSYGLPAVTSSLVAAESPVVLGHWASLFPVGAVISSESVTPPLNTESTAQVGDEILHQGTLHQRAAIHLSEEIIFGKDAAYALTPGYYFRVGESVGWETYAPADGPDAGRVKKASGAITLQGAFHYSNDGQTIGVITNFYQAVNSKAKGITRTTRPSWSNDSIQRSLIYGGKTGTTIKLGYREIWKNITRPSRDVFVECDLADSNVVEFNGARIEVMDATDESIRYRVTHAFDSNQE